MTRVGPPTVRVTGPAAVEEVWERYTRPDRWSSWAPQIRAVTCSDEVVAPGSEGTVHASPAGRVGFVVDAVDHDSMRWVWRVGPGRLVVLEHRVDASPGGTTAWARIRVPCPVALPYLPLMRLALTRLVRGR